MLNRIIRPVKIIPKKITTAPMGVTKVETPSQKVRPRKPDFPSPAKERKIKIEPTITLGCASGIFILLTRKAKERKINGKNKGTAGRETYK